ncbi:MAG: putative selenate ABC transporter substrate-binding protein [Akkermansiaceae bacterium]
MNTKQLLMSAAIGTATIFGLSSCGDKKESESETNTATPERVFVITSIPDDKISDIDLKYQALAKYLEEQLNVKVEHSVSRDYPAAVNRFANNEVQLVWFGGVTGAQARAKVQGAEAIAQGTEDPKYKSYFIAHKDTGLEKSDDFPSAIADMKFTFGSQSSTSGRVMPAWFIEQETGKTPEEFFTQKIQFQGSASHVGTAKAVQSGSVQAGVLSYKTYDKLVAEGTIDPSVAKIIWVTPDYADYNFTAHPSLNETFGEGFISKLQTALIECKDEQALAAINRSGIIKAKNSDFDGIVKVAKELGFLK